MELKVYADRMSQPSRAILIFCKANGIEFEEVPTQLAKMQHKTPEYAAINPMKQVPSIVHGDFLLFESHSILIYLASAFPGVADHWYPADLRKRAKVHSVLDWHHTNLRRASVGYNFNSNIAIALGRPLNPKAAEENEVLLSKAFETIESYWLGDGPFLLGNKEPSIADLALVCEVTQIQVADDEDRERILGPHKKILQWIEDVKEATKPHFEEIHSLMPMVKAKLKELKLKAMQEQ